MRCLLFAGLISVDVSGQRFHAGEGRPAVLVVLRLGKPPSSLWYAEDMV